MKPVPMIVLSVLAANEAMGLTHLEKSDMPHTHKERQEQGPNIKTLSFAQNGAITRDTEVRLETFRTNHAEFRIQVFDSIEVRDAAHTRGSLELQVN